MEEIVIRQGAIIDCDFEAIEAHLNEQLELYRRMVFTEETKKDAKETVAQLRKEQKLFGDRVKDLKKEYMKPYEEFFARANSLLKMYDEPIAFINDQITAFEEQRIEAKKLTIQAIYEETIPEEEWQMVLPLKHIYNPKWENATFKEKDIRDEIMVRKLEAKQAYETIKGFGSDKEEDALLLYRQNLNLTECIVFLNNYEKQKREIVAYEQARIQREAEERIRAEERAKIEAEMAQAEAVEKAKADAVAVLIPEDDGAPVKEYAYTITMTEDARNKLEMYMSSVGIEFECLPM